MGHVEFVSSEDPHASHLQRESHGDPLPDDDVYCLCGMMMDMKAIQVTFDEALLDRLDRDPAVQERGRSAVLREAAAAYLVRKEAEVISDRYRAGYGERAELDAELDGWAGEGAWPRD